MLVLDVDDAHAQAIEEDKLDSAPIYRGFTRAALARAFERVQNPEHWKRPIDAVIQAEDATVTAAAIAFFAGSPCEFRAVRRRKGEPRRMRVKAPGYWLSVGA